MPEKPKFISKKASWVFFIPLILFGFSHILAYSFGFRMIKIPWNYWQLLDKRELIIHPLNSLLLLHSQPPLLNGILAFFLHVSQQLPGSINLWMTSLFLAIGLISTLLFYSLNYSLTDSHLLASFIVIVYLVNPTTLIYSHLYFYPYLLSSAMIVLVYLFYNYLKYDQDKSILYLLGVVILLALITLLRSLFHPLWSFGILFFLLILPTLLNVKKRKSWIIYKIMLILFLITVLSIWPIKNQILFDQFTYSTWTGFNLTRYTPEESQVINNYWKYGAVPTYINEKYIKFSEKYDLQHPKVLTEINKSTGGRNWNHFLFAVVNKKLTQKGLSYRFQKLKLWFFRIITHYFHWTYPSFVNSYSYQIKGPENKLFSIYSSGIRSASFFDFRPFLQQNPTIDKLIEKNFIQGNREKVRLTAFGLLGFPLLIVLFGSVLITLYPHNRVEFIIYLLSMFTILWVLFIPILTDGFEGNRMRFAVFPYFLLFISKAVHLLVQKLSSTKEKQTRS
jgi:hypothetical protein